MLFGLFQFRVREGLLVSRTDLNFCTFPGARATTKKTKKQLKQQILSWAITNSQGHAVEQWAKGVIAIPILALLHIQAR